MAGCAVLQSRAAPLAPGARVTLEEIYARPDFAGSRHRSSVTLKVLLNRLEAWLETLFETAGAQTYSNVTRVLVLVVAVLMAVWVAMRVRGQRRQRARAQATVMSPGLVLEDPRAYLARARALLDSDAREAIRQGLYALLSTMEHRRWARPDRVKTNRELAQELPSRGAPPELSAQVSRMVAWYDGTFYSQHPVERGDAARFIDEVSALEPT